MKFTFESDNQKLLENLQEIERKVSKMAVAVSLNKTAIHVRAKAAKGAATHTGLPVSIFKKRIKRKVNASRNRPHVLLWAGLWAVNVKNLKPAPRVLKTTGQVKYKTLKGQSLRQDAFMIPGRRSVYYRKGGERLPLGRVNAPIGPDINFQIMKLLTLSSDAASFFNKTILHEMDYRIQRDLEKRGMTVR